MNEPTQPKRENVIPIKSGTPERAATIALTRLPAAMHSLRDKARQLLQGRLRELFEKADDALFELADQSTNNQEQNLYFDSMREVRLRRRAMEAAFFRRIDIGFARLLDPQVYPEVRSSEDAEVSIDELTLVQNDELEELVATEGMVNKANEEFAEPIQHLTLRIDHLVPVKVYQKNNPLGADVICTAFTEAAKSAEIDVKAKLVLFKLFDKLVVSQLGAFYQALNQLLIEANILPSMSRGPRYKKGPVSVSPGRSDAYGAGASAGYAPIRSSGTGTEARGNYDDQANQVLHTLRDLLSSGGTSREAEESSGEAWQTDDLVSLLSRAQQSQPTAQAVGRPMDIRRLLQGLQDDTRHKPINQVDDDVINLVSMMFEFILDDRNLAAPMKALLGRLQIPMVKVAIADKSFFSKGGHPARRLLNEMANAALGWQERGEDSRRTDNLYTKMEAMVQTILSDFETDMGIFNQLLFDFRAFLEKDKRRAQILEQRTIDAEDGKARSERARAEVNAALDKIVAGASVPPEADQLLREAWANVMFIACLKEGTDSQAWSEACATAEQLVWSLSAPMNKDNRQQLLKLVPKLLPQLRKGLEGISFNPYNMTQLFKQLESLHLARLRQVATTPAPAPQLPASAPQQEVTKAEVQPKVPGNADPEAVEPSAAEARPSDNEVVSETPEVASEVSNSAIEIEAQAASKTPVEALEPLPEADARPEAAPESIVMPAAEIPGESDLPEGDQHLALVGNITQGSWFEMQDQQGQSYRCRLAAIIKPTGKYIFVNRSGMKVAEETRQGLAQALKSGRLRILDDGMLFDRALEAVIGNLRSARSGA